MSDDDLRLECVRLATAAAPHSQIIETAGRLYKFIRNIEVPVATKAQEALLAQRTEDKLLRNGPLAKGCA